MYATNRGGILLPQLFTQAKYSFFDLPKAVFHRGWHFRLLFDIEGDYP